MCVISVHEVWDESRRTRLLSLSPCRTLQTLSPPPVTRNLFLLLRLCIALHRRSVLGSCSFDLTSVAGVSLSLSWSLGDNCWDRFASLMAADRNADPYGILAARIIRKRLAADWIYRFVHGVTGMLWQHCRITERHGGDERSRQ